MNTDARTQITQIVESLVSKDWVTTSDVITLRSFVYAPEEKLNEILVMLGELQASLGEIEAQYALKERELFDEYLPKVKDIQHKVEKLDLAVREEISDTDESAHEEELLNNLTNL